MYFSSSDLSTELQHPFGTGCLRHISESLQLHMPENPTQIDLHSKEICLIRGGQGPVVAVWTSGTAFLPVPGMVP